MVDANSSRATAVASGTPTSTKITWRPLRSSVSGPNIGWTEVTRPPAAASARRPSRSGLFSEPTSNTTPGGGAFASSCRITAVAGIGVATITSS